MRDWLDHYRPWTALPYRLVDNGFAIAWVAFFWYVISKPSDSTDAALEGIGLSLLGSHTFGVLLCAAGLYAIAASGTRWMRSGYFALFAICAGWAGVILIGAVAAQVQHVGTPDDLKKALGSAMWFAFAASNIIARVCHARQLQGGEQVNPEDAA